MNDGRTGVELMERRPAESPAAETGRRPAETGRPAPGKGLSILALLFSIAALIVSGIALFLVLREPPEPELPPEPPAQEEPVTFRFGDMLLAPLPGMPLNPYQQEGFRRDERGRVSYEHEGRRARMGVDVSKYQGDVDWQAAAGDGVEFAMLRLGYRGYSEGGLFRDQTFDQNLRGALDAGLEVGVYFFSQAVTPQEAEEEADYVLSVLDGQELALPVAFDWEPIPGSEARTDGLDGETMTRCAAAFCKRIQDAGYRPAVYFNQTQGYLHYDLRELTDYALWLAEIDAVPDFYYHFDLWQYSHSGQVAGIQGDVDLDLIF